MKKIKNNKGVIIFYLLIIISAFVLKASNNKNIELNKEDTIVYNNIFN